MDLKVVEVSSLSLSFSDYLPTYLPIYLFIYRSISLSLFHLIYLSIYLSTYLSIYLSIYLSLSLSLSVSLSIYLSICKLENEAILRDFLSFWTWQHRKRSNSASLPQFLNLTTSKTKQFCETNVWSWQRQKRSTSARVLHLSCKIISANLKIWCSKMQPLSGNQRPDPLTALMNMSLVQRLPRKMHLCRSSSNAPQLPSFLDMLQNHHVLRTFDKLHNPLRLPRETTSDLPKVARSWCTFSLRNALRATTACTFSTSQLPKAVRGWCALCILTSKWVQVKIGGPEQASGPHPFHTPVPYPRSIPPWRIRSIPLFHTSDPYVII